MRLPIYTLALISAAASISHLTFMHKLWLEVTPSPSQGPFLSHYCVSYGKYSPPNEHRTLGGGSGRRTTFRQDTSYDSETVKIVCLKINTLKWESLVWPQTLVASPIPN